MDRERRDIAKSQEAKIRQVERSVKSRSMRNRGRVKPVLCQMEFVFELHTGQRYIVSTYDRKAVRLASIVLLCIAMGLMKAADLF